MMEDGNGTNFFASSRNQGITKLLEESSNNSKKKKFTPTYIFQLDNMRQSGNYILGSAVYSIIAFVTLTCVVEMILSMILLQGAKRVRILVQSLYCNDFFN